MYDIGYNSNQRDWTFRTDYWNSGYHINHTEAVDGQWYSCLSWSYPGYDNPEGYNYKL